MQATQIERRETEEKEANLIFLIVSPVATLWGGCFRIQKSTLWGVATLWGEGVSGSKNQLFGGAQLFGGEGVRDFKVNI